MTGPMYFQWQNEVLCKTIYPMRLTKLRDFLVFYKEVDLWAEYRNKNIAMLQADVQAYVQGMGTACMEDFKKYSTLKAYFLAADVRSSFAKYNPLDEVELAEINKSHQLFVTSWPKDIRGERSFVVMRIASWSNHLTLVRNDINFRQRRLAGMFPNHPNRPKEEGTEGEAIDHPADGDG